MNPNAQKIKEFIKQSEGNHPLSNIIAALQTLTEACEFYEQNGAGSEEDWKLDLTTENGNLKGGRHAEEALAQAAKDLGL